MNRSSVIRIVAFLIVVAALAEHHSAMQSEGGVVAELERLIAMHKSGALDDEEFRAAKAQIIGRL